MYVSIRSSFWRAVATAESLKFVLNKFDEAARQVDIWRSHLSELCELTIILMTSMPPREFAAEAMRAPHLVFTDGAWEQGEATGLHGRATDGLFVYDAEQNHIFTQAILVPYLEARGGRAAHMSN